MDDLFFLFYFRREGGGNFICEIISTRTQFDFYKSLIQWSTASSSYGISYAFHCEPAVFVTDVFAVLMFFAAHKRFGTATVIFRTVEKHSFRNSKRT